MRKQYIFIHIGIDKTGISYIQKTLFANKNGLSLYGFKYLDAKRVESHSSIFQQGWKGDMSAWKEIAHEMGKTEEHGILSYEGMYKLPEEILSSIRDIFSGFKVKIVIYIRRQSDMICSNIAQGLKKESSHFSIYRDSEAAFIPIGRKYSYTLDKLGKVFGQNNVDVRLYDASFSDLQNLTLDFFKAIGISWDKNYLSSLFCIPHEDPGPIFDAECIYLMIEYDRVGVEQADREKLKRLLLDITSNDKSSIIEEDVMNLADLHFEEDNKLVANRWFRREELFTGSREYRYRPISQGCLRKYLNQIELEIGLKKPSILNHMGHNPHSYLNQDEQYISQVAGCNMNSCLKADGSTTYMVFNQENVSYPMNEVAAMVWKSCKDPILISDLTGLISDNYPEVPGIKSEITKFIDQLMTLGLVENIFDEK